MKRFLFILTLASVTVINAQNTHLSMVYDYDASDYSIETRSITAGNDSIYLINWIICCFSTYYWYVYALGTLFLNGILYICCAQRTNLHSK